MTNKIVNDEIREIVLDIYEESRNIISKLDCHLKFYISVNSLDLFDKNYKRDTLVLCSMNGLSEELRELKEIYAYSLGANRVASSIQNKGLKNNALYYQRDYHFRNFFSRCFSLLDHIAYMINQLSIISLIKEERKVYIHNLRTTLSSKEITSLIDSGEKIGYITSKDLSKIRDIIKEDYIFGEINSKALKTFRNTFVHRRFMDYDINLSAHFSKQGDSIIFSHDETYHFNEYIEIAYKLLSNLYTIVNDLSTLDLMEGVISQISN
ncbi:Cthe_2314 family HEPN domain-containing protein [Romboutsia lituseburensis]|uniref:Cthe_2314 family HEPN domain-containing protein n=1 Tax=Romboutsia lituseburensis TaxID=1537 RepID=UPI0022EACEF9|nr:Cthe_2314 family HEPN domain-containing protein [Romboutsia lituseburensis]